MSNHEQMETTMAAVTKKIIDGRIRKIGTGERTFKEEMALLSREMLPYVMEGGDIDAVNRLLDVLTPKNHDLAVKYFSKLLPWKLDNNTKRFGGKSSNKDMVSKRKDAVTAFLADETNNIWTWTAANAAPQVREAKPKNYASKIETLIEASLKEDKEADRIDVKTVLKQAIIAAINADMKLADIMATFDEAVKETEAEMKEKMEGEATNTEATNDREDRSFNEQASPRRKAA